MESKVALVSGANGISGNAIVEHLIRTPKEEWSKIIITSRTPPPHYWQDPRVEFVAADFLKPADELIPLLQPFCKDVTHVYFTSYVHVDDFKLLRDKNVPLFKNFLDAVDVVCPKLQRFCLQTGGKHYGCHLGPLRVPLVETMERYDDKGLNFYYTQEDLMFALQKKRTWSYNVIRPNAIIGFTPHANGMSEALTMALYFLICRETGEPAIFPGNKFFYNCFNDSSYAPSIADLSVWATTQDHCKNEAFNHCNGDVYMWKYFWYDMAKYFGLENIPEPKFEHAKGETNGLEVEFSMIDWSKDKRPAWEAVCKKYGGKVEAFDWGTWGFFDWSVGKSWPTIGSTAKAKKFGWKRSDDTYETWIDTYRSFANAGILPSHTALMKGGS